MWSAGTLVAAGTHAFTLDDTRVVKVAFGVPDSMLAHFTMGSPLPVQIEAFREDVDGPHYADCRFGQPGVAGLQY